MGVVDPPLRSLGSPFPCDDGKSLAAPPPLQMHQRLLSTTPSTSTAVSTAAGPLEDTAWTLLRVPVFFVCWLPPRISNFPPHFTQHEYRRLVQHVQGSGDDSTRLGRSTGCVSDRSHARHCPIAAAAIAVSLNTPLSKFSRGRRTS